MLLQCAVVLSMVAESVDTCCCAGGNPDAVSRTHQAAAKQVRRAALFNGTSVNDNVTAPAAHRHTSSTGGH
jgi:hypothetical protein